VKQAILCLAALLLAGCAKNIDNPEAVKEGIIKDIAKKVDVGNMDVNVDSVSFRDSGADATVSFRPKGAPTSQSMTMNYQLERQSGEWHVKSRNMESHGEQPVKAPPLQPGQTTLPAGHMAVNGGTPLPPGHPGVANGVPSGAPGGAPKQ
jgi:hypothetical protein